MAIKNIRIIGDEILREKSIEVECINQEILVLLKDMADTMYNNKGAGLAAPQIGVLKKVVVIDVGEGLIKLINPRIIESSGIQKVVEGCLSIPGKWGELYRPAKVKVEALNEHNKKIIITGTGDLAKCLCHEIDHLEGILYIDKVIEEVSNS